MCLQRWQTDDLTELRHLMCKYVSLLFGGVSVESFSWNIWKVSRPLMWKCRWFFMSIQWAFSWQLSTIMYFCYIVSVCMFSRLFHEENCKKRKKIHQLRVILLQKIWKMIKASAPSQSAMVWLVIYCWVKVTAEQSLVTWRWMRRRPSITPYLTLPLLPLLINVEKLMCLSNKFMWEAQAALNPVGNERKKVTGAEI